MLRELKSNEFERACSLFQVFEYSISIYTAIEGNNPGRIFVDDVYTSHARSQIHHQLQDMFAGPDQKQACNRINSLIE